MNPLELLVRGVAVGAVLATGIGMLRGGAQGAGRWIGFVFCLSVAGYALNSCDALRHLLGPLTGPTWLLAAGGTAYFWLFAVTLFEDQPFSWGRTAPVAVVTAVGIMAMALPVPLSRGMWIAHSFLSIVLVLHLLVVIIRSWNQDLVAVRRLFRGPFMAVIALYCLLQSGLQIAEAAGVNLPLWRFVEAVALALLTLAGAIGFLRSRPELFVAAPAPQALASPLDSARASVAPADVVAASRLEQLMAEGEIWRREGLTIGALADAVGVAEHRLRRLINQTLGYRNFADFLNGRRIEAAKVSLADPAKGRESISALAFDLGFASLGPFNRAFRDATGETPTAWRARALADLQNPSSNLKSPSNGARQGSG